MAKSSRERAIERFRQNGGILRTGEALELGIHPATLYAMRDDGIIEPIRRGVYLLVGHEPEEQTDLVMVASAIPNGIICMISALAFHQLTTQIPHQVDIACPRKSQLPRVDYPPIRVFRMSPQYFELGAEDYVFEYKKVRIYNAERTIVDCFRFRRQVGLDIALEALKAYWMERRGTVDMLMHYAKKLRVDKIIEPYLQGIIAD